MRPGTSWGQLNIHLTRTPHGETALAAHLHELLTRMESDGTLAAWFFIRKDGWWRLRFRPNDGHHMAAVKATITAALLDLRTTGRIRE